MKAYKIKLKTIDRLAWQFAGNYVLSAVSVAVEHCLAGKKAKSEYMKMPAMEEREMENKKLSEEELKRQRELFVARLETMKTNFEINHKKCGGQKNDSK